MLGNFDTTSAAEAGRDFDLPDSRAGAPCPNMDLCRRDSFFTFDHHEVATLIIHRYAPIQCSIISMRVHFAFTYIRLIQAVSDF